jgi:hypothetical protein
MVTRRQLRTDTIKHTRGPQLWLNNLPTILRDHIPDVMSILSPNGWIRDPLLAHSIQMPRDTVGLCLPQP